MKPPVVTPAVVAATQASMTMPMPPQPHMITAQTPIMMMPAPMPAMRPPPLMSRIFTLIELKLLYIQRF